jgi:hypothetical protein
MIFKRSSLPLVALFLGALPWAAPQAAAALAQPAAYAQDRPWDVPPGEFNDIQRRGFHDGVEGARRDYNNHRNPDVNNRDEYRSPDLPPDLREPYRAAFRRGYETAASHLWGAPPPPPVPQPEPNRPAWEGWGMRGLQSDAERDGFHEGQEEARKDFEFHRRADPDDHEEFRNPRVPPPLVDEYREGFMRGYEVAMSQLSGEQAWQPRGDPDQWAPPERFSEMQRRGFHDGIAGAHHDFDNHRRPNVANRDEYRTPHVPEPYWQEYREGFRRGYEMAASQLWGGM